MMCAVGGDHEASGMRVASYQIPLNQFAIPNTYVTLALCEEHAIEGFSFPPGEYQVKLYVLESK